MLRKLGVLLVLAAAGAGCAAPARQPGRAARAAAPPRQLSAHRPRARVHKPGTLRHRPAKLVLTVVDGNLNRRVPGAHVRVWRRRAVTDARGVATFRVPRLRPLTVTIEAHGFTPRAMEVGFRRGPNAMLRIYRPQLQWPLYGATPTRTQTQRHILLRPPFRVVWSRSIGALIEFPAVVWDGKAYIGNARATIYAVSMRNGVVVWRHHTRGGKLASSPAVVGNELVYHGMDGNVYVLDRRDGHLLWHFHVGAPIESSPIVRHGLDYFGAWDGRVFALDLRTRQLRWTRSFGAKITSSASVAGGRLFIGDYAGRLWALSPRTGATRWVGRVDGRIYGTPAVADGRVFAPSSDGRSLTAFTVTGRRLWSVYPGAYVYSSPAVWHGRVVFGSYNGVLYCVSAATGRILWEAGAGGPISGAAVVVDGVAYAGSFAHRIVGVDARTGRVLLRFPHGEYVPVSGDGGHLLLHAYSRLYAVVPRARPHAVRRHAHALRHARHHTRPRAHRRRHLRH